MGNSAPYSLLVGVGTLYVAPAGEAKPTDVTTDPSGNWESAGLTDGGVKIRKTQTIETFGGDQRTGKLKAVRTEEGVEVETNLQDATLENLANVINSTVTDTAAGAGTIGTRSLKPYAGADVTLFALLFRGTSAYGNYPAEYYVPYGFFDDDVEMAFEKDGKTLIPMKFMALEDPNAATEADRFGIFTEQDADAL